MLNTRPQLVREFYAGAARRERQGIFTGQRRGRLEQIQIEVHPSLWIASIANRLHVYVGTHMPRHACAELGCIVNGSLQRKLPVEVGHCRRASLGPIEELHSRPGNRSERGIGYGSSNQLTCVR